MLKKSVALIILLIIILCGQTAVVADNRTDFYFSDPVTLIPYTITSDGKNVSIYENENLLLETYINNATACSAYDGIITIFSTDNLNQTLSVYEYDPDNNSINSYAVNTNARYNQYCYASMGDRICFTSETDASRLIIYENGNTQTFDLARNINQVICIDADTLLILTTGNTMVYDKTEVREILSYELKTPVTLSGKTITDAMGNEFTYGSNNDTEPNTTAETTPKTTTTDTTKPNFDDDYYITEVGTTLSKIKKNLVPLEITKATRFDNKNITSGKVGTSTTLQLSSGKSVTVIIYGELTGEGNINSRDVKAILNHLSGKEPLEGDFLMAADAYADGNINTKDALKIAMMN